VADGSGSPGAYTRHEELSEFFDDGYDYDNAVALAKLWHQTDAPVDQVKAEAGLRLLQGETLPVAPNGEPVPPTNRAVDAFFAAGYDYTDAQQLAVLWHTSPYAAKVEAGHDIEAGRPVPVKPTGAADAANAKKATTPTSVGTSAAARKKAKSVLLAKRGGSTDGGDSMSPAMTAYFDAGYDYTNAQQLAKIWGETDINQVKAQAGSKLLNGDTLPVRPDGQPVPPENHAVDTFFAAGYDYNDAVKLGHLWNVTTYQAKIDGGKKIENGETLPIQPQG
jgi:hypothetical protein